jgi:hypothetical protein
MDSSICVRTVHNIVCCFMLVVTYCVPYVYGRLILAVTCCVPYVFCCDHRGCVLLVIGWRSRFEYVCFPCTHAHTFNKKKNSTCYMRFVVVTNGSFVTEVDVVLGV